MTTPTQDWLGHALRNTTWRLRQQTAALAALGLFIAVIIGALYLMQAASIATLNRQLQELIAERNLLEQSNEQIRSEIAQLRTVFRLRSRALELGFVEAERDQIEYLVVDGYNPNRESTQLQVAQEEAANLPVYDETFGGWLQQQWDNFTHQFQDFSQSGS
ncbi:MAG: hypothetical protein H6672_14545 [Anaerolineaceae bacterium]|nr:hypothetical protein [Anaerolineaceae bacterium]